MGITASRKPRNLQTAPTPSTHPNSCAFLRERSPSIQSMCSTSHEKITRNHKKIENNVAFVGPFSLEIQRNHGLKSSGELFCFDLLMGEPENPHFYDFGIWGRVQTPKKHFLSVETPGHLKTSRKFTGAFLQILIFINFKNGNLNYRVCSKRRRRKIRRTVK